MSATFAQITLNFFYIDKIKTEHRIASCCASGTACSNYGNYCINNVIQGKILVFLLSYPSFTISCFWVKAKASFFEKKNVNFKLKNCYFSQKIRI